MTKTRKHTRFQTCERHRHLDSETRYRRAEFFAEGGPAGEAGCRGGLCRLWPGTDIFEPSVCHEEMTLDWTTPSEDLRGHDLSWAMFGFLVRA